LLKLPARITYNNSICDKEKKTEKHSEKSFSSFAISKINQKGRNVFQNFSSSYLTSGSLVSVLTILLTNLSNKQPFLLSPSVTIGITKIIKQAKPKIA